VRDTGAGIAPEELPRIFERFHRVANVRTRTHEGLGIGLAFVSELARLHGGALGVTSSPGAGSTFTVSIPYGTAHLPQDRLGVAGRDHIPGPAFLEEAESWLGGAAGEPSGEPETLDDATILVVDDNADMCSYLRRVLGARFRIDTAADGADALACIRRSPPDLVVSDVMMPGLDGFELIAALAADEPTREVPVILLSARAGEDERSVGLEAGAADYLVKPFAARELIARVNTQLALARLRRQAKLERVQLEEASRAKDEFLAMLGHELRNPLAPIATAVELLKLRHQGPPSKQLTIIERQVQHLIRLVDDLLDVSRITRGLIELRRAHVDVRAAIGKAIETARTLFDQRRHRLDVSTAMSPMTVMGDEARLVQVLSNLLTNAARYTPPGGHVRIAARPDGGDVVISVNDDGAGIAPELLPRVFDMFVQGKRGADRSEGGLGLGLALVRTLVDLHGGSVSAHSDGPGRGAEFVVRLPSTPRAADGDDDAPDPAIDGPRWTAPSRGHRVLVVDDNHDAVETLAELLRATGYEVAVAFDGLEALALADSFAPTIAILDLGLPIMDGFELAGKLRARRGAAPPWLAAVTGYGQDQDRARTREAGFDLHLVKPIQIGALIEAIESVELPRAESAAG
jgi:signal transduction histidine kinase